MEQLSGTLETEPKDSKDTIKIKIEEDLRALEEKDFEDEQRSRHDSDLKEVTKTIQKQSNLKKTYSHVSDSKRIELIEAVKNQGKKIKHMAESLGINYSSAKSIYQVYKKEGRVNRTIIKKKNSQNPQNQDKKPLGFQLSKNSAFIRRTANQGSEVNKPKQEIPDVIDVKKDILEVLKEKLLASKDKDSNQHINSIASVINQQNHIKKQNQTSIFPSAGVIMNPTINISQGPILIINEDSFKNHQIMPFKSQNNLNATTYTHPQASMIPVVTNTAPVMSITNGLDYSKLGNQMIINDFPSQIITIDQSSANNHSQTFLINQGQLQHFNNAQTYQANNVKLQNIPSNQIRQDIIYIDSGSLGWQGNQQNYHSQAAQQQPVVYLLPQDNIMSMQMTQAPQNNNLYISHQPLMGQIMQQNGGVIMNSVINQPQKQDGEYYLIGNPAVQNVIIGHQYFQ